jgi:hypothetical protein
MSGRLPTGEFRAAVSWLGVGWIQAKLLRVEQA